MDSWKVAQDIMALLRKLYAEDPVRFETEMGGVDLYKDAMVQQAIERLLRGLK